MTDVGTSQRVSGHTLEREGAPHDSHGHLMCWSLFWTSGEGRGACSCGALSPVLSSATKRKAWHREHKAQVLAAAPPQT